MPISRPLAEWETSLAEEYDGEYFSFGEWVRRRISTWARKETEHGTLYARFVEFLTHEAISTCESCGKEGEWFVSDICIRCHRAICTSCARLHYKLYATLCRECYRLSAQQFLQDARRSERRRTKNVSTNKTTEQQSVTKQEGD